MHKQCYCLAQPSSELHPAQSSQVKLNTEIVLNCSSAAKRSVTH